MNIVRQNIDQIERVYATSFFDGPEGSRALAASEGFGECKVISLPEMEKKTVIGNPGGTTDLCPHPEDDSVFFAICQFLPVFKSEEAKLVYVKANEAGEWEMKVIKAIPFLHRFEIIKWNGKLVFFGGTLCGSKKDTDDWSDPGKLITGEIDPVSYELKNESVVLEGLTRNHGFIRNSFRGIDSYLISGDTGVWVVPLDASDHLSLKPWKLFDFAVSDIAALDIDGDGEDELALISPFHGSDFSIMKRSGDHYEKVYEREIEFGHVLWGGAINGKPSFLLGYRKGDEKILIIRSDGQGGFTDFVVDEGAGPSQVSGVQGLNCFHILSANRKVGNIIGNVAIYSVFEE